MNRGAHFSDCGHYRYALWRIWNENRPVVMFIGLNPSKGTERKDDPTIRRVTRFANDWGYGGFYMMNLFAWITPYPFDLKKAADPLGDNNVWLTAIAGKCDKVVFCWGAFPAARDRAPEVIQQFPGGYCFGLTKGGSPLHPLFLPAITQPVLFTQTQQP